MKLTCPLDYSRKTPNRLGGGYTFPKSSLWNFKICHFTFGNSRENKLSPLEILQNCVPPLGNSKVKNQDTLVFLYKTPINSTSFLIGPWYFHVPFLQYPWSRNSMYSTLGPCLDFFWNSPSLEMPSEKLQQKCSVIWSMSMDYQGLENQYHKISSLEFEG